MKENEESVNLNFDPAQTNDCEYVVGWIAKLCQKVASEHETEDFDDELEEDSPNSDWLVENFVWGNSDNFVDDSDYQLHLVSGHIGGEGGGEDTHMVFAIAKSDAEVNSHYEGAEIPDALCYIRTTGFYASYSGTEWSGEWELVKPRQVTKIIFESEDEAELSEEDEEE